MWSDEILKKFAEQFCMTIDQKTNNNYQKNLF